MSLRLAVLLSLGTLLAGCGAEQSGHTAPDVFQEDPELPSEPTGFLFVIDAAGPFVVIDRDPESDWAIGPIEIVEPGQPERSPAWTVTRRAVDVSRLSPAQAKMAGREVVLRGEDGESCSAVIGELELLRRTDFWEPAEPRAELARSAWEAAASRVVLGGRAEALAGSCVRPSFATLADAPEPRLFTSRSGRDLDGSESIADAAIAALRGLEAHAEIDASYRSDGWLDLGAERAALWDEHGGAGPSVAFFVSDERWLIGVDANVPGGCGEFGATLWALYEVKDGTLLERAQSRGEPFPRLVLDVEDDGRLELLAGARLLLPGRSEVTAIDVDVPFYGCPC